MASKYKGPRGAQWIQDAKGVNGEPVPPSVLAQFYRYAGASRGARYKHALVEFSSLAVAASIPAMAAFAVDQRYIAVIGAVAVFINGFRSITSYKENWANRTKVRYAIEQEIAAFAAHSDYYSGKDAAIKLVGMIGEICKSEREGWVARRLAYEPSTSRETRS